MTALRETPISFAICAQDRPALKPLLSCAMRSAVHVSHEFLLDVSMRVMFGLVTGGRGQTGRGQGEVERMLMERAERMTGLRLAAQIDAVERNTAP
jgi:hypothetical protein